MWPLIAQCLRFLADTIRRFIEANPRNAYEQAVFSAARTIIITAFLKPIRGAHEQPT